MSDDARDRSERALRRRTWPGALRQLDDSDEARIIGGEPGELIAAVTALTLSSWAMMDRALPDYSRANAPGRIIRSPTK